MEKKPSDEYKSALKYFDDKIEGMERTLRMLGDVWSADRRNEYALEISCFKSARLAVQKRTPADARIDNGIFYCADCNHIIECLDDCVPIGDLDDMVFCQHCGKLINMKPEG